MEPAGATYDFGPFRLDTRRHLLLRGEDVIPLTPKVYDLLLALATGSGSLLTKQELMATVWGDTVVEENNLNQGISALRKALDEGKNGRFIETVPRLGYRFVANVQVDAGDKRAQKVSGSRPPGGQRKIAMALAVTLLVLGAAVAIVGFRRPSAVPLADSPRAIAVLPFVSLGLTDEEYLGVGMADALITRLANVEAIEIRPTSAVDDYSEATRNPVAVGRMLDVDTVLDGRVQRSGDRLRVTAQLIDVRSSATLWSGSFDEPLKDIFALQDTIAERLADNLVPWLTAETKRRFSPYPGTRSAAAYEAYLKGRWFWNRRTPESQEKAIEYFLQATGADPNYAQAYAGLADAYLFSTAPVRYHETKRLVKPMALKALELDDTLAEAHASLAYLLGAVEWDWQRAEREFQRAIELNPSYVTARHWHAYHLAAMGRLDEAVVEIRHAQKLDPVSLIITTDVGHILYFARQYDQAIEQYRKALELEPKFAVAHWRLGEAYALKGMYDEAIAELQESETLGDFKPDWLGYTYGRAGQRGKAQRLLKELKGRIGSGGPSHAYGIALIYTGLGDHQAALDWLEKAYAERLGEMALVNVEPMLDPLRSDRRYSALLRRMGL